MKKLSFTLLASAIISVGAFAQSQPCGTSGAAACVTGAALSHNGFEFYNDLECFESGVNGEVTVRFKNFSSISIPDGTFNVEYLKIDGFGNLPCGVCWATNKSNNVFAKNEQGCIKFSGLTTDAEGQYKLVLNARAQTTPGQYNEQTLLTPPGGISSYENDIPNVRLYLRVKANGSSTCTAADSTQASKVASSACTGVGINETALAFNNIQVSPNPLRASATVTFAANESGDAALTITDITGKTVYRQTFEAVLGENTVAVDRNNLAAGIYFININKGKSSATKRFVIAD